MTKTQRKTTAKRRRRGALCDVTRRYQIESMHWLPWVDGGHKCRRQHGHTYAIEVTVRGPFAIDGFVLDFYELDAIVQPILDRIDHHPLNDHPELSKQARENPTTENLAQWLFDCVDEGLCAPGAGMQRQRGGGAVVVEVAISENPQSVVRYAGP